MKKHTESFAHPGENNPSVIVGWNGDTGKISELATDYLIEKLDGLRSATVDPSGFFSLEGVSVEENCIQFPASTLYTCRKKDLLLFKTDHPAQEHYRFLNSFFDLAERYGRIHELYTINGIGSQKVHTSPRRIFAVFNSPQLQDVLLTYDLDGITWEGTPSISSFLLWIAWKRGFPGLSLWLEVPFYLAAIEDFQAIKLVLSFFNERFNLSMDLGDVDKKIEDQNRKIEKVRNENPEVNKCLSLLESGLGLKEEMQTKLTRDIYLYCKNNV